MADNNMFIDKDASESYFHKCPSCSENMIYKGGGRYCCEKCGEEFLTDFGKVKRYLEEHGPTSGVIIARETGVRRKVISDFLREGRVEIKPGTENIPYCASCGIAIRFGTYCAACEELRASRRGKGVFNAVANLDGTQKGEMRFNKDKGE
ncbi:MAG: hypothetical protein J1F22_06850 [Lachnospiraceae bacterium]|nr:hypothetical protein [Lachnospiraceae bacterium]